MFFFHRSSIEEYGFAIKNSGSDWEDYSFLHCMFFRRATRPLFRSSISFRWMNETRTVKLRSNENKIKIAKIIRAHKLKQGRKKPCKMPMDKRILSEKNGKDLKLLNQPQDSSVFSRFAVDVLFFHIISNNFYWIMEKTMRQKHNEIIKNIIRQPSKWFFFL